MANGVYNTGKAAAISFTGDTIKIRLVPSTYTFNTDHATMTAVGSGIGTDQTVANKSVVTDQTNDFGFWKSTTNPSWTAVAGGSTVGGAVLYKFGTVDGDSIPICFYDLTDTATNGGDITVTWASDANGGVYKVA